MTVLAPSPGSASLAQRGLGREGASVQVRFTHPRALIDALGAPALLRSGLRPEPSGWLSAVVLEHASGRPELEGFAHPRWAAALATAVGTLEGAGVDAEALRTLGTADAARSELLSELLEVAREARRAAELYGAAELARSAAAAVAAPPRSLDTDEAYVVIGDTALSPLERVALEGWLATRPGRRITLPLETAAAEDGLQVAAAGYPAVSRRPEGQSALERLQAGREGEPADDTLRFTVALDERREAREAVRHVLEAVEGGMALDQIAVALPSAEQADLLWAELEAARVPFVSLVGPPSSSLPGAGLLRAVLAVEPATLEPETLYGLLSHPELSYAFLPEGLRKRRGRWRRLLVDLGALRGLDAIRGALIEPGPPHDAEARSALLEACGRLDGVLAARKSSATWAEHLEAWRELAQLMLRKSEGKERLLVALEGRGGAGGALSAADALGLLEQELSGRSVLRGRLNDPAVRILPPLELSAVDAELVVICGLSDGNFPRAPREDPVLSDTLIEGLVTGGFRLEPSTMRDALERRRFFAAVGAARRRLVLSAPRSELLKGRPLQPGLLMLEAARLAGRADTFDALERVMVTAKTDAAGTTKRPEAAISEAEYRQALLAAEAPGAMAGLVAHPFATALVRTHLAIAEANARDIAGEWAPGPETGWADPARLPSPVLGSELVDPWMLARALEAPARHFVRDVLGARPPKQFPAAEARPSKKDMLRFMVRALEKAVGNGSEDPWTLVEVELADRYSDLEPVSAVLTEMRERYPQLSLPPAELDLAGISLKGQGVFVTPEGDVLELRMGSRKPNKDKYNVEHGLSAALVAVSVPGTGKLRVEGIQSGDAGEYAFEMVEAAIAELMQVHVERLRKGAFFATPDSGLSGPDIYLFTDEPRLHASKDLERVRAWLEQEDAG